MEDIFTRREIVSWPCENNSDKLVANDFSLIKWDLQRYTEVK